ncbi:MAG: prolyl oligopeptidase family serine peptidase [Bacteroidales bacterium]
MKKLNLLTTLLLISITLLAQKKPLDHSVYDSWKAVAGVTIPQNGNILIYSVNEQEGNRVLNIKNLRTNFTIAVPRGTDARLNKEGTKVVATIKPLFEQTRQAKIKKTKRDDMPKDTLAIIDLKTGHIEKYANCKSLKTSSKPSNYAAFELTPDKVKQPKDTSKTADKKQSAAKEVKKVFVINLTNNKIDTLLNVASYSFNETGSLLAYTTKPEKGDSTTVTGLFLFNPTTKENTAVLSGPKESKIMLPQFSKTNLMAFYANTDTTKQAKKEINIYLYNLADKVLNVAASNKMQGLQQGWIVNENGNLYFSEDGTRLFFGTSPKPLEKDTTLVEFEQPKLDIWSWDSDFNQPMQLLSKERDLERTYSAYINTNLSTPFIQLGIIDAPSVSFPNKGMADYALLDNDKAYRLQSQWNINPASDIYLISAKDGSQKLLYKNSAATFMQYSPNGEYAIFYDAAKKAWMQYDLLSGGLKDLTSALGVAFDNQEHDTPSWADSYGNALWFEDGKSFIIPDKFDYWKFDATGKTAPVLLTGGAGRTSNTSFQYMKVMDDLERSQFLKNNQPMYFTSFNHTTKETGVAYLDIAKKGAKITTLVQGPYTYANLKVSLDGKGKNPIYVYTRANFEDGNNVWMTADNFKTQQQISNMNPQQKEYNWGTVELVKWKTLDSIDCEGLLYKPENFDATKKYPVMIYFYEKNSDGLYGSKSPAPSRSTVNIPYFVSNEYIVFVPDIYYQDGHPGQCAMRSIMPGVEMLEKYPWIDSKNMAIQGQSWGGYQVAYMITQTNKFKAAGAGAAVVNMTSAYGGMRWGSGMTRQFQYEQTQSRIGKTLWDGFDLYYENSPLFFLPNVTTPVLIMHNDKDGAVPWYQGIEYFTCLRRLGKTAWLLQYNDEDHNLVERRNAKDLSIRLSQFFDHYLKGAPMPEWMKNGRPAVKKDFDLGYDLVKE